jgi:hypothetical protein
MIRNSSGVDTFVVGTTSVSNLARLDDGTDDRFSYLYALSPAGKRLWLVATGPPHVITLPQVAPVRGTNFIYALAYRDYENQLASRASTNRWHPTVFKFDRDGHRLQYFPTNRPFSSMLVAGLDGSGAPLVLVATGDGSLLVLNADLHYQREVRIVAKQHDWVDLRLVAARDLDCDGRVEVVLSARQMAFVSGANLGNLSKAANVRDWHDNAVIILDADLRVLTHCVIKRGPKLQWFKVVVSPHSATGDARIVALEQEVSVLRFRRR